MNSAMANIRNSINNNHNNLMFNQITNNNHHTRVKNNALIVFSRNFSKKKAGGFHRAKMINKVSHNQMYLIKPFCNDSTSYS